MRLRAREQRYGLLPFYGTLLVLYVVAAVVYLLGCAVYARKLLLLHAGVAGLLVLGVAEVCVPLRYRHTRTCCVRLVLVTLLPLAAVRWVADGTVVQGVA